MTYDDLYGQSVIHPYGQFCVGQMNVFAFAGQGTVSYWSVSGGGTIISNSGNSIQVVWNSPVGSAFVDAYYNGGSMVSYPNITISSSVTPSVSISASQNNICQGTSVTFTATPVNGGSTPSYYWYINGSYVTGGSSNNFTTSSLTNGQQVTCVMYTSVPCYTASSATSNAITMTVNTPQTMTITISGNTSICQGSGAGFSASVANGVGNLTYQWKKNGNNISSDNQGVPPYALSLNSVNNGDVITCVVTSSGCAYPATSNSLTISIVTPQNFTINPSISVLSYCLGGTANFTASSSHSAYNYQWYVNGSAVSGANSSTFTTTAISVAQLQSVTVSAYTNAFCVNNTYASGSSQYIPFIIYSPPVITGNLSVIAGSSTTLTATGNTPNFRWYDATGNQIYQGSQYSTPTTLTPGVYTYQIRGVNSDGTCLTDPVSITVTVNFPVVIYTDPYNSSNFIKTVDLSKPVGTINGSAGTTPTGGVTYSIPIYASPGTNGMEPSIGVVYNSQSGNGVAGYGWNISGLSAIGRTGKNIYFNGVVAPVTYTVNDAFVLDGMKLNVISGSNGANGAIYATEAEAFAKIISYTSGSADNPDWFQVTSKDGSIMEFGHTSDSRILTDNETGVILWRLNKIIDIKGNYIEFKYENGLRNSRIDEINYTGNVSTGLLPYNKIKFNYQGRSDANTIYEAGSSLTSKSLLTTITVSHDGQLVKTYQFNYGFDNITSLLKEVVETAIDGTSLNSTIFLYGDSPVNFSSESTPAVASNAVYQIGDFNADGLSDIMEFFPASSNFNCRIYGRSSTSSPLQLKYDGSPSGLGSGQYQIISKNTYINNSYNQILSASSDFKGDGKEDFLITNSYIISSTVKALSGIYVLTSYDDLTGFYLFGPGTQLPVGYDGSTYTNCSRFGPSSNYIVSGDFDGDGTADIITFLQNDNGNYFSHFTSTRLNITHAQINPIGLSVSSVANAAGGVQSIDFDGDGKMELLVIADDRSYVLSLKAEQGSYTSYRWDKIYETSSVNKDSKIFYGDFNADGKIDLLVRNGSSWQTLLGTGLSFIGNTFTFNQNVILNGANGDHKIIVTDFNGDGKSDILHMYNDPSGKLSVYYSKDIGGGPLFYYEQYNYNRWVGNPTVIAGDLNGDGRGDLITALAYGEPYDIVYIKPNGKERLLSKVTDGHNVTTAFEYKSLTDKSTSPYFYDRTVLLNDPANQNPYNYIQPQLYAVSSLKVPNGIGGTTTTSFNYENAIVHRAGRGFLGFKKIIAKNSTTGITTVSENEINTQFASCYTIRQSTLLTATSELLSESQITTTFTNLSTGVNDKRFLQKTDKVLNIDYLLGKASEVVNIYDNYGNITNTTLKTGTLSGSTVDALTTVATTANYSVHNTPVPAKPDNITILKTRTGMPSVTSTTSFLYTSAGLVSSKTEFVGLPKAVTTAYGYNSFGNNTSVTVSAAGLDNRVTNLTYDPSGRFLTSKQLTGNGVSQTEIYSFDAAWGKTISQTSSDCLTTTFE